MNFKFDHDEDDEDCDCRLCEEERHEEEEREEKEQRESKARNATAGSLWYPCDDEGTILVFIDTFPVGGGGYARALTLVGSWYAGGTHDGGGRGPRDRPRGLRHARGVRRRLPR